MTPRAALLLMLPLAVGCDALGGAGSKPSGSAAPASAPKVRKAPEPRCSPSHSLTDDERFVMMEEFDQGKKPCPGWVLPKLSIEKDGLWLNGERLEGGSWSTGNLVLVKPLFDSLKKNRESWKSFHPNGAFPGKIEVTLEDGMGSDVGLSVLQTVAYSGSPNMIFRTSGVDVELSWHVAGRGGPAEEIFIEPVEGKGYQVGLWAPGPPPVRLRKLAEPGDPKGLDDWLTSECGADGKPCSTAVRIRALDGPFVDTLKLIERVQTSPIFKADKPAFALTFQCPEGGGFMGLTQLPSPWGPRFPAEGHCHLKPAPERAEGAPNVSGRLAPTVIQRVVRGRFADFRRCYEAGLADNSALQGRVVVKFVIGRDGKVSSATAGGDLGNQEVDSCVAAGFRDLVFPPPEGGIVTVSYPIVFTPGG